MRRLPRSLPASFPRAAQTRSMTLVAALLAAACSHAPPPDFAPDPGLVAQIQGIRIITGYSRACPGALIPTTYEAVLMDGSRVQFARSYDKNHPPRLHVVFLDRESPDAFSQEDGDWVTERDPLATVSTGFRLTATMRAKPSATSTVVIPPYYGCMPHAFAFAGEPGGAGEAGGNGPDVSVRLGLLRSPFYDQLYVAGIQVGVAPPFYILGDAAIVPPAAWLVIDTRGGRGGSGLSGANGSDGAAGATGCPAQPGGPGGSGGNGGPGGAGGHGGRINVIVPVDQPLLAGLVEGRSPGGPGGQGGAAGTGGRGGKGGQGSADANNRRCADGSDGAAGRAGIQGPAGSEGAAGPRSIVVTAPTNELFGMQVPPGLGALLERLQRRP